MIKWETTLAAIVAKNVRMNILLPPFSCSVVEATSQVYNKTLDLTTKNFLAKSNMILYIDDENEHLGNF